MVVVLTSMFHIPVGPECLKSSPNSIKKYPMMLAVLVGVAPKTIKERSETPSYVYDNFFV